MKLPRRTVFALLLALACANILVRLPRTDHETGVDSFFIHNLATAISDQGRIPWVLNPLGYFGWYPLSYPSAAPVLISGVSQTSGLTGEGAILALSMAYGVLGALAGFVMARAFRKDDAFALLVALLFSLAPRFMAFTLWSASARNLFMVLIPAFVWLLVRAYRRPSVPNVSTLVAVLALMIATHRLTILLAVVIIAFVMAYVFILLNRVARVRFPKLLLSPRVRRWIPWLVLVSIAAIAIFMLAATRILNEYAEGELCEGASVAGRLCNLGVSITRSVGLALPFAILGVMTLLRQRNKGFLEALLVFTLLALIPTLFLRSYTGFYILPFLALFGWLGVVAVLHVLSKHRRARNAAAVASILIISGFSVAILQVEVDRSTVLPEATYSTSMYLAGLPAGNFVANDGLLAVRVSAVSGRQGLPVGGAGTTSQSPELLIMHAFNTTLISSKERRFPLTNLTIEDDSPFYLIDIDARHDWIVNVMRKNVNDVPPTRVEGVLTLDRYDLQYYIEADSIPNGYYAFGNSYDRGEDILFTTSVHALRYKIYDGNFENVYLAFPPWPPR